MIEFVTRAKTLAALAKVGAQVQRARNGDPEAVKYLITDGGFEALDAFSPGTGMLARELLHHGGELLRAFSRGPGDVIDGEFRELEPDFAPFTKWKMRQPSGTNIVVGQTGSGKTELGKALGVRLAREHGYGLEFLNFYAGDVPRGVGGTIIDEETLIGRMGKLQEALKGRPDADLSIEDAALLQSLPVDAFLDELEDKLSALPFRGRVLVIDEMGMSDDNPNGKARKAIVRALTQSRHLNWHVIYLGQLLGQFAKGLLGQSTMFFKGPTGREADMDRNLTWVKNAWRRAALSFAAVRDHPNWRDFADERAWAHVEQPPAVGLRAGFAGLCPFTRLGLDELEAA